MIVAALSIRDAWSVTAQRHQDDRGWFQEWFKHSEFKEASGVSFEPVQLNISHSVQGTIRGVHYSVAPRGQAKLIMVMAGEIDDYIIDIRPNSPTYGQWERVRLSAATGHSVILGTHLAHAFQVISPEATVCYATTAEYDPGVEKAINPLCPTLAISWNADLPALMSPKDRMAPSLDEQHVAGLLPQG
jgi:dTDP-4-dehydrorhamnose 3,5-epimerase